MTHRRAPMQDVPETTLIRIRRSDLNRLGEIGDLTYRNYVNTLTYVLDRLAELEALQSSRNN